MPTSKKPSPRKPAARPAAKRPIRATPAAPAAPDKALAALAAEAAAIPARDVLPCRLDIDLALHNVEIGLASIRPHLARLREELPALPLDPLLALPLLGATLRQADEAIAAPTGKEQNRKDLEQLRTLRLPMLLIAEGLALLGLLPARDVRAIRSGSGALDSCRDGVALARLYRKHAATLAGKHPFDEAALTRITTLGEDLTARITPDSARRSNARPADQLALRDRFFTLLVGRHAELRRAGHYLFGEALDEHVPALQAGRRRPAKPQKPASPPAPLPA